MLTQKLTLLAKNLNSAEPSDNLRTNFVMLEILSKLWGVANVSKVEFEHFFCETIDCLKGQQEGLMRLLRWF